jgi:hypothetical protein
MSTTRGRLIAQQNLVVFDQADFFQMDGFTRVLGLIPSQLICQLFFNNEPQPWPLTTGAGVSDAQVASGKVYWVEVPGQPGIYNIRWRPNAMGYWRLLITYTAGTQIMAQDYDVISPQGAADAGLKASFIKSSC